MFDFGSNLRELRESHHMSQTVLGKKVNKSKSVISSYENNIKTPTLDVLTSLAVIYNVSLDYLVGMERKETIVLDNMTEHQRRILCTLTLEFREKSKFPFSGFSPRQLDILSSLLMEFSSAGK